MSKSVFAMDTASFLDYMATLANEEPKVLHRRFSNASAALMHAAGQSGTSKSK